MQRYRTVTLSRVDSIVGAGRSGRHRDSMKDNLDIGAHALLGIIMLDTTFARPPGDVGNPESRCSKMLLETESEVGVRTVVCGDEGDLLDAFIAAETL